MSLDDLYERARTTPGDIFEHVPTLRALAQSCEVVTEFGVRYGVSTVALLAGRPRRMVSYDVERHEAVAGIEAAARSEGIDFTFVQANVLSVDIEPTDLLFIDTKHTYDQLRAELSRHGEKARRFIAFHDTVTYGTQGEDGGEGLLRAIREYFDVHSQWRLAADFKNNNGLTVYTRGGS